MKRTKGTVTIAAGDELYEISKDALRLKAEIETRTERLEALRVRGAKLMKEHGWEKGACDEFTVIVNKSYNGLDFNLLKKAIPDWKERFVRRQLVEVPKLRIYAKAKKKSGK